MGLLAKYQIELITQDLGIWDSELSQSLTGD